MSIFDMFKKIFSSGSDDGYNEPPKGGIADLAQEVSGEEDKNYGKSIETRDNIKIDREFKEQLLNILVKDSIQDKLIQFNQLLKDKASVDDILSHLNALVNQIVNSVDENVVSAYFDGNPDLFKMYMTEVIINHFRNYNDQLNEAKTQKGFDEAVFKKEQMSKLLRYICNPSVDLYNLCEYLSVLYDLYISDYGEVANMSKNHVIDIHSILKDAFYIVLYYRRFQQKSFFDITDQDKTDFLNRINEFVRKYGKDGTLNFLYYYGKLQQKHDNTPHSKRGDIIGGSKGK